MALLANNKDVLRLVLAALEDPHDVAGCCMVCRTWRDMLEDGCVVDGRFRVKTMYWFGTERRGVPPEEVLMVCTQRGGRSALPLAPGTPEFAVVVLGSLGAGKSAMVVRSCASGTFVERYDPDIEARVSGSCSFG
jgi:hypothetical protein